MEDRSHPKRVNIRKNATLLGFKQKKMLITEDEGVTAKKEIATLSLAMTSKNKDQRLINSN